MPRRSITPGRKPSMRASAFSTNCNNASTPSGLLRSSAILRRPRNMRSPAGVSGAGPRTACARSTRMTSAPMSASNMAANGPGPMPAISITLYPLNGPAMTIPFECEKRCDYLCARRACAEMLSTNNGHSGFGTSCPMSATNINVEPGTSSAVRSPPDGVSNVSSRP